MPITERLYYQDCFRREFEARVVRIQPAEDGGVEVVLDRTAFYPSSGGQPHDLGTLDDIPVEDVRENDQEEVVHLLPQVPAGKQVHGRIDWPRRFDHMQQHTGQHLLSAAFVRLFAFPTVSFHLGRELCTIDLQTPSLGQRQLRAAEELANQVIFEDRPVHICFASKDELEKEGVRRGTERVGELRLIEIEDFDRCACGGTHVARTGQIGLVLLRGVEKLKKHVRVEFVCGGRALAAARADYSHLQEAAHLLTTGAAELPTVLRKQMEERRAAEKARTRLLERLAEHEAHALLEEAESHGERRLVVKVFADAEAGYLRLLAARLVKEPGVQLLFASQAQPARPAGGPVALVFAQSRGLSADMNGLLREIVAKLGGKGGGSRDFAQGSAPEATRLEEVLEDARRRLRD